VDGQPLGADAGLGELAEQAAQLGDAAVTEDLQAQLIGVGGGGREQRGGRAEFVRAGEPQPDVPAGDAAFELIRGSFGDDAAVVEHRHPAGEPVGLVEVLGGEEDRDAVRGEFGDDLPHGAAAARVEPCGGFVEEDQPGVPDEGHHQVQAPPHAAGVGRQRLAGRVGELEPVQQLGHPPPPGGAAEVAQVGHQLQVLLAGEQVVDR